MKLLKKLSILGLVLMSTSVFGMGSITQNRFTATATDTVSPFDFDLPSNSLIFGGISAPSLSGAGKARVYYDSGSQSLKISENGGAYQFFTVGGATAISSINADTTAAQLMSVGVAGVDFAITNPGAGSHVFNLPVADGTHTGKLLNTDWTTFNSKQAGNASLTALGALAGTGYITQTGANTFAERTLTGTANQVIITNGDGVAGTSVFSLPQDIALSSTPTFSGATLSGNTAKSFLYSDASKNIVTTTAPTNGQLLIGSTGNIPVVATLTGTVNQISVTNGSGSITLTTPQDIATSSSPIFSNITITNKLEAGSTATFTDRLWDFSDTVTSFSGGVITKFLESNVTINSAADLTTSPIQGAAFVVQTDPTNTKNYNDIRGTVSDTYHKGSGTVGNLIGAFYTTANTGIGPVTTQNGFVSYSLNGSTATVGENRGAYIQFGNSTGGGTIGDNYGLRLVPYNLGAVNNNIAIKIEDMTGGSVSNIALQTGLGLVKIGDKESIANRLAVGNDATLVVNGAFDKFIDFSQTITDFTASGSFQGLTQYVNFAPTVNLTGGNAKYLYVAAQEAYVPVGNSKNIQQVESTYTRSSHQGSGTVTILYGNITQTDVTGTGSISSAVAQTLISSFDSSGTGNINIGQSLTSGGSLGTVAQDYTQYINPPNAGTTVTTHAGEVIANQSVAGQTTSFGLQFLSQSANAATTRAIEVVGTGISNAIRLGSSANIFSNSSNNIRLSDVTNTGGLDVGLTTSTTTINTVTNNASILWQNQTFTPGASHAAVSISPTWSTENFAHSGLIVTATQNGTDTNVLTGISAVMVKATGATTLGTMYGFSVAAPTVTGTVTTSNGINVADQTNVNITTPRAINIAGTGVSNAEVWGGSALQYANAANNIRLADSSNTGGLDINLTTTSTTINTVTQNAAQILFQTQTLTPGGNFSAIVMNTTFASENFNHNQLFLNPTQSAGNTQLFQGLAITMNKTGGGTLATMNGVSLLSPVVSATVTASNAVRILDQGTAGITTPRGIRFTTAGVANSIVWANSALQYSTGAENISFLDSTNAAGFSFTMTAASTQTIATTFGNLALNAPTTNKVDFQVNAASVGSINATEFVASNGQKGKVTTSAAGVYTILLTDFIIAKTGITGGGDIVRLPSAVTAGAGKIYRIKDQSGTAATNNITVTATAGNVDGAVSTAINTNYGASDFYSDGSNWFKL